MSSVTSTIKHWRSKPTVSHRVSEPMAWSTPSAVDVVSIVDHNSQESVSTALLKEVLPADKARTRAWARRAFSQECHSSADHELRWSLQNANFITPLFWAERLGLGVLAVIVDDDFHGPSDAEVEELRALSHARRVRDDSATKCRRLHHPRQLALRGEHYSRPYVSFVVGLRGSLKGGQVR